MERSNIVELDVRPILEGGVDPFEAIMGKLKQMNDDGETPIHMILQNESSYTENQQLRLIEYFIEKGEKIAIVGGSGSGKTTLVNLLTRMYDPVSGTILIDEIPSTQIKLKDLRTLFGTVTQESILFNETIKNNIGYGTFEDATYEQVSKAAEGKIIKVVRKAYPVFACITNLFANHLQFVKIVRYFYQ